MLSNKIFIIHLLIKKNQRLFDVSMPQLSSDFFLLKITSSKKKFVENNVEKLTCRDNDILENNPNRTIDLCESKNNSSEKPYTFCLTEPW